MWVSRVGQLLKPCLVDLKKEPLLGPDNAVTASCFGRATYRFPDKSAVIRILGVCLKRGVLPQERLIFSSAGMVLLTQFRGTPHMALSPSLAAASGTLVDHTRHKTALCLLPFLFLLYVTNYLDRTSLAYAAIGMRCDLGFSDTATGFAIGVFFISYVALQIPGALLVERWSAARRMISITLVVWGTMTALTALVHTPLQLYVARFLLGAAEAGFFPGVIVYLSHWFLQADRAKATSNFMSAIPVSSVLGSPLAGLYTFFSASFLGVGA